MNPRAIACIGAMRAGFLGLLALMLAACSDGGSGGGSATGNGPKPSVNLTTDFVRLARGSRMSLRWTTANADACVASGSWSGTRDAEGGEIAVGPSPLARDFTYILTCYNEAGTARDKVVFHVVPDPAINFWADKTEALTDSDITLTWSSDADSCTASGAWQGTRPATGSQTLAAPPGENYFKLTCSKGGVQAGAEAWVNGIFPVPTLTLTPNIAEIHTGETVTLDWSSVGTGCEAGGNWSGTLPPSGSQQVTVGAGANDYTISCGTTHGSASTGVTVTGVPFAASLAVWPPNPFAGDEMTLRWRTNGSGTCTASGDWSGARAGSGRFKLANLAARIYHFALNCTTGDAVATAQLDVPVSATGTGLPSATDSGQLTPAHAGSIEFPGGITLPASKAWAIDIPGDVASPPLVADGRVFVTVDTCTACGEMLYAIDAATGRPVWGPVEMPLGSASGLAYDSGKLFVVDNNGYLRALDASSGNPAWTRDTPGSVPLARYGVLYRFEADDTVLSALDSSTGNTLWSVTFPKNDFVYYVAEAVTSSGLYLSAACAVYALAPEDGAALWSSNRQGCDGSVYIDGRLMAASGRLFARDPLGDTEVLDELGGNVLASWLDGSLGAAISGSTAYRTYASALTGIDTDTGNELWSFSGDGHLDGSPIVVNSTVFVGSTLGTLYAVDATTGAQQWTDTVPVEKYNISASSRFPWNGMVAGEGYLLVSSYKTITAWRLVP